MVVYGLASNIETTKLVKIGASRVYPFEEFSNLKYPDKKRIGPISTFIDILINMYSNAASKLHTSLNSGNYNILINIMNK